MTNHVTLQIEPVPAAALQLQSLSATKVAVGMQLATYQILAQMFADQYAPHFSADNEPVSDGRSFVAAGGAQYYRPTFRVASREAPAVGPEVRFLKDIENTVRLVFELEEVPILMPPQANPFPIRIQSLILHWNGGQRAFGLPTLVESAPSQDPVAPAFSIRVGDVLTTNEVEALNAALSNTQSGARIDITYTYGYWVDTTTNIPDNPPRLDPSIHRPFVFKRPPGGSDLRTRPLVTRMDSAELHALGLDRRIVSSREIQRLVAATEASRVRERSTTASDFRTQTVIRSVQFTFDAALEQNQLIFSAIRGTGALQETWTDTEFGLIRRAPYPNTVYYMPHDVRLAFNPEMGTAHVVPNLYRDEQEEVRVRVVLRAVPWFDPERALALRDHLYRSSAGTLASPHLVAGGYQQATLKLLTAFPEQIQTLNDVSLSIDLSGGVDLTLDLSLEFYRFVSELLTGPLGIVGEVRVLLQEIPAAEGAPPVKLERIIPLRLQLDNLACFPVSISVSNELVRPDEVVIRNETGSQMKFGGCLPRLLQVDSNSVVPLEVYDGETETTFPLQLGPNENLTLKVKPILESDQLLWNAVEINLIKMSLMQTSTQILERIHEIAPSGTLSWKLVVKCPLFARMPLPQQFSNLFSVEVQVIRPGFSTEQVILTSDQPGKQITMQRALKDFLSVQSAGQYSFKYRVRNVYFDHTGKWSEETPGEGSNLFVFPNPVDGD
jgi:hypothetical protein